MRRVLFILAFTVLGIARADEPKPLPRPDGKPADMTKPVKVFILMGQSNMLGMGKIKGADKAGTLEHAVKTEKLYPFLIDDVGAWTVRQDVRNVRVMVARGGGMGVHNNEWMTIKGNTIGPEIGIGHELGNALSEPVLILKSCIGNRALGWDLLPPGSARYEYEEVDPKTKKKVTYVYAGSGDKAERWVKGEEPKEVPWYAGKQYDDDVKNAKSVLEKLGDYYPGATKYEVAGFLWWQGERDTGREGHAARYEHNLVNLIRSLRKDFNAPEGKFVLATLGEVRKEDATGNAKLIFDAMMNISDPAKHPQFKGATATVYSHPLSKGGSGNSHYNGDARTYMNVGLAMGRAMVELLKGDQK
ncbi:MAG: hypothetical protein KF873_09525 [Gemmataceae bacterium]|nr:hypothetical protein [Gemmataceae bacterium]